MAESQGGLGDREHEEGLLRRVFGSKRVVFAISGAKIAAIASAPNSTLINKVLASRSLVPLQVSSLAVTRCKD